MGHGSAMVQLHNKLMPAGSLRDLEPATLAGTLLALVVINVVEDAPHQVPPLLAGQHFGQEVRPVLQCRYVCGEAFLECYSLTHKMLTNTT